MLLCAIDSITQNNPWPGLQLPFIDEYSDIINTPNGTPVDVMRWISGDWTTNEKLIWENYWMTEYPSNSYLNEATRMYNCHAYAWTNQRDIWMDAPNQEKYWEDLSYVEVDTPSAKAKVSYTAVDHSARIAPDGSGKFVSKWNAWPLFEHHFNDSPFQPSGIKYYDEPEILGNETIFGTATYSINSVSPAVSVLWSITGAGFSIPPSSTGSAVTVTPPNNPSGQKAILTATLTYSGKTAYAYKTITASAVSISGPDVIGASCSATYTLSNGASGTWSVVGGGLTYSSNIGTSFTVSRSGNINDPQSATIRCDYTYNGQPSYSTKNITVRIAPVISSGVWGYGVGGAAAAQVGIPCYFKSGIPADQKIFVQQYQWELYVNGTTYYFSGETTQSTPMTFSQSGTYMLRLRILDGCQWSKWVDINVDVM